jgi:catechol 2,3-dioxygenase-like lactoylglutathione lyase family enzyme
MKRLDPSHQISRIALSRRQLLGGLAGLAAASSAAQAALLFRPSQLNHLTLNVSDLERSRAFYGKLFGGPQWTISPAALDSFDLGSNPLGLYPNPRGTPVGVGHFCIGLPDFNGDTVLSTLKQKSMDGQKAANGGIEFRDLDRIKVELVSENYRNRGAEPQKRAQPLVQSLFRPVGLNHVTLQVADLERATKFYESLLGPSFDGLRAQTATFRLGMARLALINYGVNPVGVDNFCVSVEGYEPDVVSEKLQQNGIPSQRLYEPNQVFVRDPDGILVQLAGPDFGNR